MKNKTLFTPVINITETRVVLRTMANPLHKQLSFPLKTSSVNVTKSSASCRFGHIYWRSILMENLIFCILWHRRSLKADSKLKYLNLDQLLLSDGRELLTLHKKWSFPLQISSLNVTKSAGSVNPSNSLRLMAYRLGNFIYMRYVAQTFLWALDFVIHDRFHAPHHQNLR